MKRVGFILKADSDGARELLAELTPWLVGRGVTVLVAGEDGVSAPGAQVVPEEKLASNIDIAVVLGGDGTMLRAAALVADKGVPLLGVNLGHLGFLTPFDQPEAQDAIIAALEGRLALAERARLQVSFQPAGGATITRSALNDAVVHQGGRARLIELEARLDDKLIASYRVDGLIVCTPTGSTAYNLAAGGPILAPGQATMAITPICAHALTARPLVVPQSGAITVSLGGDASTAVLTLDGQWARPLSPGDRVDITATAPPLRVFLTDDDYFDILREKLHWGGRSDR